MNTLLDQGKTLQLLKPCSRFCITCRHGSDKPNKVRTNRRRRSKRHYTFSTICNGSTFRKINYPGSGNYSTFSYDSWDRNVVILEFNGASMTSTKQFVWARSSQAETRDGAGLETAQFFHLGQTISSAKYYYTTDHLGMTGTPIQPLAPLRLGNAINPISFVGSTRELTDTSGTVQGQWFYDSFGRAQQLAGTQLADIQFGGYYHHAASGFSITMTRAYNPSTARFLNRDTIEEAGGINLFVYLMNSPIAGIDPFGLFHIGGTNFCGEGYSSGQQGGDFDESSPNYPRIGDPGRGQVTNTPLLHGLDLCCMQHDDCMNAAHHIADASASKEARKCCDRKLFGCGISSGNPLAGLFGIGFGIKSFFRGPGQYIGPE